MRNSQFVAVHQGGPLDLHRHRLLALWAADCAERVLLHLEGTSQDDRPRCAVDMARAWGRGEVPTGSARAAAIAAHRAAREVRDPAAVAAARAAGHAAATTHMADHAPSAAVYALRALAEAGLEVEAERAWQIEQIPEPVRELVLAALASRAMRSLSPAG